MDHNEVSDYLSRVCEEQNVRLEMTCYAAPVSIEGSVDGKPLYYRSRGTGWQFVVYTDADLNGVEWVTGYDNGVNKELDKALMSPFPWSTEHEEKLMKLYDKSIHHPDAFEYSYRTGGQLYDVLTDCIRNYRQYVMQKSQLERVLPSLVETSKLTRMWILAEPDAKDADDLYIDAFYANNSGWGLSTIASKISPDSEMPFVMLRRGVVMIQRGLDSVSDVCAAMRIDAAKRGFKYDQET